MDREPHSHRYVIALLVLVVAAITLGVGYLIDEMSVLLAASMLALVVFIVSLVRLRRLVSFFRQWSVMSNVAHDRNRGRRDDLTQSRRRGRLTAALAFCIVAAGIAACGYSELIRESNLDHPGPLFLAYTRTVDPEMADLIELYVIQRLPIEHTDSADLRILRNLYFATQGYRFTDPDLVERFSRFLWYRPRHAYPNDLHALPSTYQARVQAIQNLENKRAR